MFFFSLDKNGEIVEINYSNQIRDTEMNLPLDKVIPLFEAMKAFDDLLNDERNCITYKLNPGKNTILMHY